MQVELDLKTKLIDISWIEGKNVRRRREDKKQYTCCNCGN
jgi:hypothetical protein